MWRFACSNIKMAVFEGCGMQVTEGAVVTLDVLGPHNYFEDRDALEMVINAVAEASAKQLSRYAHMYLVASDK